jgi:hypothetical protein
VNGEPPVEIQVFLQPVRQEGIKHLGVQLSKSSLGSVDLDVSSASGGSEEVAEEGVVATAAAITAAASTSPSPSPCPSVELVARIKISNSFAIYDEDIIDLIAGEPETDPPPWLELETVITDELNFRTGEQLRVLQVQVHCPETGQYFPPLEASLPRPRSLR